MIYAFVLFIGLAAGALSGVIGTGSSIMLLPALVYRFGPKQAVPIMAIASLMANIAKVAAWWREVDWKAFAAYTLLGMPAAALGARTLLVLPSHVVDIALGVFFLARSRCATGCAPTASRCACGISPSPARRSGF